MKQEESHYYNICLKEKIYLLTFLLKETIIIYNKYK